MFDNKEINDSGYRDGAPRTSTNQS